MKNKYNKFSFIPGLLSNKAHKQIGKETDTSQGNALNCSVSCGKGTLKQLKHCNQPGTTHKCSSGQKTYQDLAECIQPSCPECFNPMRMPHHNAKGFYEAMYLPHSDSGNVVPIADIMCADVTDKKQYFEIDFGKPIKVTGGFWLWKNHKSNFPVSFILLLIREYFHTLSHFFLFFSQFLLPPATSTPFLFPCLLFLFLPHTMHCLVIFFPSPSLSYNLFHPMTTLPFPSSLTLLHLPPSHPSPCYPSSSSFLVSLHSSFMSSIVM